MRQIGMINFDLLGEFELTVTAEGMPPYPATTQQAISRMPIGRLRPGMTLQGAVDQGPNVVASQRAGADFGRC